MKQLIKFITTVGALTATLNLAWAGEEPLRLENPRIAVEIDRQSGALCSIRDKKQDAVYPQTGIGFEVVTNKETFLYDMPNDPAVILSLEPAPAGSKPRQPALKNEPKPLVVPAF
jgi:hypothetical protein